MYKRHKEFCRVFYFATAFSSLELFRSKAKWHYAQIIILLKARQHSRKEISSRLTLRSVLFLFVGTVTATTTTTATTAARYTIARVRFAVRWRTAATFTATGIFAALTARGARVARTAGLLLPHFLPDMVLLCFLILLLTEVWHNNVLIIYQVCLDCT